MSVERIKTHLAEHFHLAEEQIEIMLPTFISTLENHMKNLEDALKENNPDHISRAGHKIKGAFLNLGLKECAQLAFDIEEKGKVGDNTTDFSRLIHELRAKVEPVFQ